MAGPAKEIPQPEAYASGCCVGRDGCQTSSFQCQSIMIGLLECWRADPSGPPESSASHTVAASASGPPTKSSRSVPRPPFWPAGPDKRIPPGPAAQLLERACSDTHWECVSARAGWRTGSPSVPPPALNSWRAAVDGGVLGHEGTGNGVRGTTPRSRRRRFAG